MIATLLFCGCAFAESQPPTPTPAKSGKQKQAKTAEAKQESGKDLRGTDESPLVVDILPSKNADKIAEWKPEKENEKSTLDRLTAYATVSLAGITALLALFTAFLWWKTRELVMDAKDSAQRQLRAYVSVETGEMEYVNGAIANFQVIFYNAGQTPAHGFRQFVSIGVRDFPFRDKLDQTVKDPDGGVSILHPGAKVLSSIAQPVIDETMRKEVTDGRSAFYLWGSAIYKDAFDREHVTIFRFYLRMVGNRMAWIHDKIGNNAT